MKRFLFFAVVILAIASQATKVQAQNVKFDFTMTVPAYIETMPSPVSFNFGTAEHNPTTGNLELTNSAKGEWDIAYANCPFSVTITGDNPNGDGIPRFARLESGATSSGYDVLSTMYQIFFTVNGATNREIFFDGHMQADHEFPHTKTFNDAPHNGQVKMDIQAWVNSSVRTGAVPMRKTKIDPNMTWDQSADAGEYACSMVVTFSAL